MGNETIDSLGASKKVLPTRRSQPGERERPQTRSAPSSPIECPRQVFEAPHQRRRLKQIQSIINGHGVPLEGEIIDCASDSAGESASSESVSSMPVGHADEPNGYAKHDIPDAQRMPLEGEQVSCASGGGMNTAANGHTAEPSGHADGRRGLTATPSMSNKEEMVAVVPQTCNANASTYGSAQQHMDETDGLGNQTNMSSNESDTPSIAYGTKTASDTPRLTREPENESPDPTTLWKQVGIGDANISLPRSTPFEMPSTPSQDATYGQPQKTDGEFPTKDVEGETAGGDGKRSSGDAVDGTTSSGDIDPMRVEVAMLAGDSQIACCEQNMGNDLPELPDPFMNCQKHSCALIRPKHQCGRIKPEARNVSTARKVENACQGHGNATRSTRHNREGIGTCLVPTCKCWKQGERRPRGPRDEGEVQEALGHVETKGRRCQTDGATSSTRCNSKRVETRLLARDQAGQHKQQMRKPSNVPGPPGSHQKCPDKVSGPKRRLGTFKFEPRDVSRTRKAKTARQG
ncbi:hypothetical protein EDC04DRAFT_3090135 [Pisolithus marmoratus]|nr:hypothetical protein EDC04DRAFT_3090135 [Pisolithus marmoratus]